MLTPKDIKYIVDWAEAGNKPRDESGMPVSVLSYCVKPDTRRLTPRQLNSAGLTIAELAKALEQANATADGFAHGVAPSRGLDARAELEKMRANKKELLG